MPDIVEAFAFSTMPSKLFCFVLSGLFFAFVLDFEQLYVFIDLTLV